VTDSTTDIAEGQVSTKLGQGAVSLKIIARMLILATLAFGAGCAKSDWIERTLVTVDVTGTWNGPFRGSSGTGGAERTRWPGVP
jgi:hypothetical protein